MNYLFASTNITINVSEISNNSDNTPTNIVSDYDGIITDIKVESGFANVKKGDVVKKGDILVTGTNGVNFNNKFVKSKAVINAKITEIISVKGEFIAEKKVRSGKFKKKYILDFFTLKFPIFPGKVKGDYEKEAHSEKLSLFGKDLPVILHSETFYYLENCIFEYQREELLSNLEQEINKKINEIADDYEVISTNVEEVGNELTLIYEIKFSKNIGLEEKILINTSN